ncbi:MAG: lamin tail domain-containing protein [Verrucomicrobia bacterium]|nr:lamin tail domain-containing protein [Verrucomicrobiota bacterium]
MRLLLLILAGLLWIPASRAATLGYWRFEEGPAGTLVYHQPAHYSADSSGGGNHGYSFSTAHGASYAAAIPLPVIPQTGAANQLSLYTGPGGPVRDLYTVGPINQASLSSFTLEASVQFDGLGTWQTFVGRDANFSPLSALYFQLVQDAGRENHVGIKVMDNGSVFRQVFSRDAVVAGRWYHFAAIADSAAHTLTLWRYDEPREGYVVENTTAWNGPMAAQGASWTLGRGFYNGAATDAHNGRVDEVRISDTVLPTNELLWFWAAVPAAVITTQPTNVTVNEFASATFAVGVSGRPPFGFRWFRDGAPIAGATHSSYTLETVSPGDHGARFHVVVSNVTAAQTNTVTSSNARLTVIADQTPPTLLGVQWLGDPNSIAVTFSEPLDPASALALAHYTLDGGLVPTGATLDPDARTVVLATSPLAPGATGTLRVSGVRDRSAAQNVIVPDSTAGFACDVTPLVLNGTPALLRPAAEPLGPCSRRTPFVLSEIHYHPPARADGRNAEFIEVFNSQPWPEDLSGFRLSGSIDFAFPSNTVIAARGFLVVAAVPADVAGLYGLGSVLGPWSAANGLGLPNDAGTLRLHNRLDAVLLEVNYTEEPPWPTAPDGGGHSLVLARPSLGEADPHAWQPSQLPGGSPGTFETVAPPSQGLAAIVINELLAHALPGHMDVVELFNFSTQTVDLAGCVLTDNPETNKFVFPPDSPIGPLDFVALDQTRLGFGLKASGDTLWLKAPDGARVLDAARFGAQESGVALGRSPDGGPRFARLESLTPGVPNARARRSDVVISEIMFHPVTGDSEDEYVELWNCSAHAMDLGGWQLRGGMDFAIPSNTVLGADSRLVIAKNAARLLANDPRLTPAQALGDFRGKLGDGGDILRLAMPAPNVATNNGLAVTNLIAVAVDEFQYRDGGRWGRWADGGGSSLERVDPRADPCLAPAWADSDESARSDWVTVEASGVLDLGTETADSLQILLLGPGECLVDDVEVIPQSGGNLIPNPGFESGVDGWYAQGSHARSAWETAGGHQSASALRVVATDRGDTGANRVRAALTSALTPGQGATIRAKVRWLRGAPEILLRLRGNYLEAPGRLLATTALGTPAGPNSRAAVNAGPAVTDVTHAPVLPSPGQPVTVMARVSDPDPLAAVTLSYRLDPDTTWSSLPMRYRGAGVFTAELPGQPGGALAAFVITAADAAAFPARSRFPAQAPLECLVRWGEPSPAGALGVYRLWLTAATLEQWVRREKLSNDPLDTTFVYGDFRVIYNAGAQFSGSPWHSQFYDSPLGNWCNYALFMPGDDRLLGRTDFRIYYPGNDADDQTAQREQFGLWLCEQLGLPSNHQRYIHFFVNGVRRGIILEDAQTPDPDLLDQVFGDPDGELYKVTMWHEFEDNAATYVATPATLQNFTTTGGAKKIARYRWIFAQRGNPESAVAYTNLFALVDAANWPPGGVVSRLDLLADTDAWMRLFAFQHAVGNWDSWGNGNGQNTFLARPAQDRWRLLPVDADILLGSAPSDGPTTDLFKCTDPVLAGLYTVPAYRRAYWRALLELAHGPFLPANVNARLDPRHAGLTANGAAVASPQSIKNYVATRRSHILSQAAAIAAPFAVAGPTNLTAATNLITLSGTAPVEAHTLEVNGVAWPVTWTSLTNWVLRLPLAPGPQTCVVQAVDPHGLPLPAATATLTITFPGTDESPVGKVLFSEIMAAPVMPDAEYVELFNASTRTAFDLSGWRVNGLDYTFPTGAVLLPGAWIVVAKDLTAYWTAYGLTAPAFGQFNGNLQSDGETLTLIRPGPTPADDLVVDRVTYATTPPWPRDAAGAGAALQLIDPAQDNSRVGNWTDNAPQWRFFSFSGNSGSVSRFTRFSLYFDSGGDVFLDDLALVTGTTPGAGTNYLKNGHFESVLSPPWVVNPTGLATPSTITNGLAHGGTACLRFVNANGPGSPSHFYQFLTNTVASGLPAATDCTLSFWYLPNGTGTLNAYLNAGFHISLPLGGSTAGAPLTPGTANAVTTILPSLPPVYLNEVQPLNLTGPADDFGEREPWIELHNAGASPLELGHLSLASQFTNLLEWTFPTGAVIPPGAYGLVWADAQPDQTTDADWHSNFRLSPTHGAVVLSLAVSNTVVVLDYLAYLNVPADRSFGAWPEDQTSYRTTFHYPTPLNTNNPAPPPATLFINEWMAANSRAVADPADGGFDDWFELFNPDPAPVNLENYLLTDNPAYPAKFRVPAGIVVPGSGYLLVWADEETGQTRADMDLHVNFKLAQTGETIGLFAPDGSPVDSVGFGAQTDNLSQGRYPDGQSMISFLTSPTPRAPNVLRPPLQPPELVAVLLDSQGLLTFSFATQPGYGYQVEYTGDLAAPNWTPLQPVQPGTGSPLTIATPSNAASRRFYRVVAIP